MIEPARLSYTFVSVVVVAVMLPKNNVATLDYRDERPLLKLKQQQNSHATQKVTYFRGSPLPEKNPSSVDKRKAKEEKTGNTHIRKKEESVRSRIVGAEKWSM